MENLKVKILEIEQYLKILKSSNLERIIRIEESLQNVSNQVLENRQRITQLEGGGQELHTEEGTERQKVKKKTCRFCKQNKIISKKIT